MTEELQNKELLTIKVSGKVTELVGGDDSLKVVADKNITFTASHHDDCCEHVWADFGIINHYKERIIGHKIENIVVKSVPEMGILLCFNMSYNHENVFVPCYNEQNGYYSSNLELIVNDGTETKLDISDSVEDKIE